ncbi:MAG: MerR family transcriptional regulator [Candidatus Sericytochromatia bacterium]|nr:MerR family transcriptional regulator [Candidatus Tanganyikabacteria bacterium]
MAYTVKRVADLAGVTVRTLHHYDRIGLLKPSAVSGAGYRLYGQADLARLQEILILRELDCDLARIRAILDAPAHDRRSALLQHRERLAARQDRIIGLIATLDRTIAAMEGGTEMSAEQLFEGFDDSRYRAEAEQRWGKDVVADSYRRMERLSAQDRDAIKAEAEAIGTGFAGLVGRDPADPEVQAVAARHHAWVNRFWDCSPEAFRNLGQMYVDDARFTATYDRIRPGLAVFVRDAMAAFADAFRPAAEP